MSEEQLKAFLEKVQADTSLQEKLKAAGDADAVAAIAKEAGFSISADDLTNAQSELYDQELEGVAGGLCGGEKFPVELNQTKEGSRYKKFPMSGLELNQTSLHTQTPCYHRGFLLLQSHQKPHKSSLQYLAPLTTKQSALSPTQSPNPSTKNTRQSK